MRLINIIKNFLGIEDAGGCPWYKSKPVITGIVIGAFLFCIGINLYLRLFPAYFPQYKKQAQVTVKNKILDEIEETINQAYSDYNLYAKQAIRKEMFKARLKDKEKFKQEVNKEYFKLKDKFQNEDGQTYLLELDPYHWARYTANVLENGHPGDETRDGKAYDTYMLAPIGRAAPSEQFLFYSSAYLYTLFNTFYKGINLQTFLFYLPLLYVLIFLVLLYFFTKSVFSHMAAFFTTLFVGFNIMFVQRSCAGWFDSDSLSLIMPLLIVWFILLALKDGNSLKKIVFFALCAAVFQGTYPTIWMGWWFIFLVVIGFYFCSILNNYLIHQHDFRMGNKENLKYWVSLSVFVIGTVVFCFLLAKENCFYRIFYHVAEQLRLGESITPDIWPNTYYTVGELMSSNLSKIADYLHGKVIFMIALIGMFCIYIVDRRSRRKDFFYLMFFWCVFMVFASLKSVRFCIFLAVPLGVFLGGCISNMPKLIKKLAPNPKLKLSVWILFVLLCMFLVKSFLIAGYTGVNYTHPLMNDHWQKTFKYIKANTPQDAIINSWWDYGDLFKTEASRRVIFDGQSQNTPLAYWMGQVLLAKDEDRALRILRMLNNSSTQTFGLLNKYISNQYECVMSLEKLLSSSKEEGRKLLMEIGVTDEDSTEIISNLHKKPSEAYFIVESSMLSKINSISFLGNWDFRKLYVHRNISKPRKEVIGNLINIFGLTLSAAQKYYEEIVITPSGKAIYEAISERNNFFCPFMEGKQSGALVHFDNGVVYNLDEKRGLVYSARNKKYKEIKDGFIFENDKGQRIENEEADFDKGVFIVKLEDKYKSIVLDTALVDSLFVRMYLLEGRDLEFFELFYKDEEAKIYVYKIKWEELD
ncbi:MAG: dolichyl-diphosphooligosaccharide--protein glycosyltransferase subunit STT3 [Candidatus Omnitrophica bacterium]|nr:dolichyl-diphosphooligosaccharide--protein glycosyltransferase subunit STT3 [Candidatus Omnitrophota bacterium]